MTENGVKKKKGIKGIVALIVLILAVAAGAYAVLVSGILTKDEHPVTPSDRYVYNEAEKQPMYYKADDSLPEKGWIDDENGEHLYYCEGEGKLATGWKYLEKKVWYFYQESDAKNGYQIGRLARNYETPGKLKIPETGCFEGEEALALAYGIDVLNRYGWDLKKAYKYSSSLRFETRDELDGDSTIHEAALIGFETGKGNCMVWSGTFCTMAKLLGEDCRLVWGTLVWNGVRPHAWTEIWVEGDDQPHVYDPRKNEGQDFSGFDVRYGDRGTYKYNLDSRVYVKW